MPSKRDFVATAKIIKAERELVRHETGADVDERCVMYTLARIAHVARELATSFAATNPHFNRARFLAACDVNDV